MKTVVEGGRCARKRHKDLATKSYAPSHNKIVSKILNYLLSPRLLFSPSDQDEMPTQTHYEVLGVRNQARPTEIRSKYLEKVRTSHPDRSGTNDEVIKLYKAYECLSDEKQRKEYDEKLSKEQKTTINRIYTQISLDQFDVSDDQESFSLPCRCGNEYCVTADDLESGLELLSCSGCSERIHVLYEMVEE